MSAAKKMRVTLSELACEITERAAKVDDNRQMNFLKEGL